MTENARHRAAFDRYWRMDADRSIRRLHAAMASAGPAPGLRTLYEWSRRFHWQARIRDLEERAAVEEDAARRAAPREMAARHAKEGLLLQRKGAGWLETVPESRITAEAAIRAVIEGTKLERLARGEPTERVEQQTDVERKMEELDDVELDHLIRLVTKSVAGDRSAARARRSAGPTAPARRHCAAGAPRRGGDTRACTRPRWRGSAAGAPRPCGRRRSRRTRRGGAAPPGAASASPPPARDGPAGAVSPAPAIPPGATAVRPAWG